MRKAGTVLEHAYAKINLTLEVTGRRPDGYHEVRMAMQQVSLHDRVLLRRTEEAGIVMTCNDPGLPTDGRNLMVRAAEALFRRYGIPGGLTMALEKRIPVSAGLAGGSSDAAAVLRGVNRLYGLGLSVEELCETGIRLGADIPFCIRGGTLLAEGIGERLSPLPHCPRLHLLLVKPPSGVSTPEVYAGFDRMNAAAGHGEKQPDGVGAERADGAGSKPEQPDRFAADAVRENPASRMREALLLRSPEAVAEALYNDLQPVTQEMRPAVGEIVRFLRGNGALNALMSGSGPTVFGLFETPEKARIARRKALRAFPDCFAAVTHTV
ncbi:MAG: 4-(cytidine 5'-diphospho)-2-C-methyl-D-erythritol kinase [Lachnospiraceae bacterium]|nr:4-(cytidine 5'-diphospho)-2-C-methyl-D-erythritol kinase [Lachnospiraceae bacterium]